MRFSVISSSLSSVRPRFAFTAGPRLTLACGAMALSGLLATGCASSTDGASASGDQVVLASAGPVNTMCPIGGHDVNASIGTVVHKGQEVAFCCEGCLEGWEDMSDADRDEAVASVVSAY